MKEEKSDKISIELNSELILNQFDGFKYKKESKKLLSLFLWSSYKKLNNFSYDWYCTKAELNLKTVKKVIDQFIESGWISHTLIPDEISLSRGKNKTHKDRWVLHKYFYRDENIEKISTIVDVDPKKISAYKTTESDKKLICSFDGGGYQQNVNALSGALPYNDLAIHLFIQEGLVDIVEGFANKYHVYMDRNLVKVTSILVESGRKDTECQ